MNFPLDRLMKYGNYDKTCETFFSLAEDKKTLDKLKAILYDGELDNYSAKSGFHCRDNPKIEIRRRIALASVLLTNPETFDFFIKNDICIFHGTNANALPGILKYGINSHAVLEEKGVPVLTGEASTRMYRKRNFISFTDVLDIAEDYSTLLSPDGEQKLSFSVVIGVSQEEMNNSMIIPIDSDVSEIGVDKHFPLESISCICVPEEKVNFVKKIVNDRRITVLGIRDLSKKLYYYDDDWNITTVSTENYKIKDSDGLKFKMSDVYKVVKEKSFFKMKDFIGKVKKYFGTSEEIENGKSFR